MHRLASTPGGWTPEIDGVVLIDQTPADLVFLTSADTDIQTLAIALRQLPDDFPSLRVVNFLNLQQQLSIDIYAEQVLSQAKGIVLRLLGGRAYWSYGLEVLKNIALQTGATLLVLPGDDRPDPDLISHSTLPLAKVTQLWQYFTEGGVSNFSRALQWIADLCLATDYRPLPPEKTPRVGHYPWAGASGSESLRPRIGIVFYRAHYLAGNTAAIDALCEALAAQNLEPVPLYAASLRQPDVQAEVMRAFAPITGRKISLLLNTTSFALGQFAQARTEPEPESLSLWANLDVPVLQVILSGGNIEQWQAGWRGLSSRDLAMHVALPEVDGAVITTAISFKAVQTRSATIEADIVTYQPVADRIHFIVQLAARWVDLQQTPAAQRRIALVLANYPARDGRLANGVGLDSPASVVEILRGLQRQGYTVPSIPVDGDALIQQLTQTITHDPEVQGMRPIGHWLSRADYQQYWNTLPIAVQTAVQQRWGAASADLPIAGCSFGNIFIGLQPPRGYEQDPNLSYHAPDLEPTHAYLGFYHWLRQVWGAQAIVHVGKHGNLEWLPGKSVALSQTCYPEVALGPLPHFYPFIVNDPGEGSQAKRRAHAVILDHLTPPLTRAELYGALQQLETLVEEYAEAETLDPTRLPLIRDRLLALIRQENLHSELGLAELVSSTKPGQRKSSPVAESQLLNVLSGYLCDLKESQIRDGLHIFGICPSGQQLRDLAVSIARAPSAGRVGLTRAIARAWGLTCDPLSVHLGEALQPDDRSRLQLYTGAPGRTIGDAVSQLETVAANLVELLLSGESPDTLLQQMFDVARFTSLESLQTELHWLATTLLPALRQTDQEIDYLLRGLAGRFVPAGAAGAPTRGRPEVLPTGRNFYSVDLRAIPTETAWDVGRRSAEAVIERYTQEQGEYPRSLALSIWGTATMRTGGDDLAEALALLGVRPVWDGPSRRVVDFEILPVSVLGRPRVDVTLRVSGFFRDAFPNLIDLFDQAVIAVSRLDETVDENPLADRVRQESQWLQSVGFSPDEALQQSRYRIFSAPPGAYGTGLQGLLESQQWQSEADLAQAFLNWSSYAYGSGVAGQLAPAAFSQRLQSLQIVLHNQDNREHDILDSDDYYQFQGGLSAAVRSLTGQTPTLYFGDHARPEQPRIRTLQEEITRVYRARVVNPKWIAGAMRHGYKGAFEMAATVDFLFAYSATTGAVPDYVYDGVAQAYLLDATVHTFIQEKNPWALRDMAERFLEAHQRGLWQGAKTEMLEQLRTIVHTAESQIEQTLHSQELPRTDANAA